ncbi:MAG: helix-turn-helix transcriptional regulator [Anaerolineae bacterium]|nr:helix-turn-helix transcriptional regulator [Anaerolineae bacterium]
MAIEILATKLYVPPPPPKVVVRPRLIKQLNDGLSANRKLILVSAPAGFGKTMLVSEWLVGCGWPASWLSLDEGDNDFTGFITYLIAALQTISVNIGGRALAALQSPQLLPIESVLTILLNEIAAIRDNFILVLDDYHLIDSQPVDQALVFLLEHLPRQMRLVIATREDPSLPLARYRAKGQLIELRAADLQFTPAEAAEFLNEKMGLNLRDADIVALETRTEGWIAGLQLAALSMQNRQDPSGFIQSFTGSHHFVLDYLVEEVLGQQPESTQTFLLRTSILSRMCGVLCEAVLETPPGSGQSTLEALERANLFLVPLDNERRWYRYHHLFGDLLRQRLGQPQELSSYHLRASGWYEANNDLAEAYNHALAAGDFERAARLAEAVWEGMERSFQTAAWLGWVKKLPDAVICSRPRLCVLLGRAFSDVGELDASETCLRNAEVALAEMMDQDAYKSLPGTIALIRAGNAQILGNLAETVKYAELSIRLVPEDDIYLRAQAAITLGFTHWTRGDLEASLRAMRAWIVDMQRLGNHIFAIASAFAVADMQVILDRLGEAEASLLQAIQLAVVQGNEVKAITAHHHLGLALLAHERGDDATAAQRLQSAAELGQRTTLIDWPYRWNLARARLKESARDWDAALDLLDEAGRVYVKNPIPMLRSVEALKARIYLKQGRLDQAASWVRERGLSVTDEVDYLGEYEYLTLARVWLGEGVFTGVNELLTHLLALAEAQKRKGCVIEILLTQALLHQAQGNHPQALAALERALALAQPEGYLRIFVDEGEAVHRLLLNFKSANEKQTAHPLNGYVDKILAAFSPRVVVIPKSPIVNQGSEFIEPLTERELEILHLIAEGRSNAEIGQRLYLALSTIKGYNLRIFNKLQAQNRTEAVARARELGLL